MFWTADNTGDLEQAIAEFHLALPGWWFSVGLCHVTADATVAPDSAGQDAWLLVHKVFDEGFDAALAPPATMADALRAATSLGHTAKLIAYDRERAGLPLPELQTAAA